MTIISRYLNRNRHKTRISGIEVTQEHTIPLAHAPGSVNQSLREDSGLSLPDVNSDDTRIKPLKPDGEAEATSKNIENLSTTWVIMRDEVTAWLEHDTNDLRLGIGARQNREVWQFGDANTKVCRVNCNALWRIKNEIVVG